MGGFLLSGSLLGGQMAAGGVAVNEELILLRVRVSMHYGKDSIAPKDICGADIKVSTKTSEARSSVIHQFIQKESVEDAGIVCL